MKIALLVVLVLVVLAIAVARREAQRRVTQPQVARQSPKLEFSETPDAPVGFGRKCQWIAVRAPSPKEVADALGLSEIRACNWHSGSLAAYAYPSDFVFVTPAVDGWVLAVGGGIVGPDDKARIESFRLQMRRLSTAFGQAQFYGSHRGASYAAWAIYDSEHERRLFSAADDIIFNVGEPRPEEADLMARLFDSSSPDAEKDGYWEREDLRSAEEEDVLRLAGAWSVNPIDLDKRESERSVGLVGRAK